MGEQSAKLGRAWGSHRAGLLHAALLRPQAEHSELRRCLAQMRQGAWGVGCWAQEGVAWEVPQPPGGPGWQGPQAQQQGGCQNQGEAESSENRRSHMWGLCTSRWRCSRPDTLVADAAKRLSALLWHMAKHVQY